MHSQCASKNVITFPLARAAPERGSKFSLVHSSESCKENITFPAAVDRCCFVLTGTSTLRSEHCQWKAHIDTLTLPSRRAPRDLSPKGVFSVVKFNFVPSGNSAPDQLISNQHKPLKSLFSQSNVSRMHCVSALLLILIIPVGAQGPCSQRLQDLVSCYSNAATMQKTEQDFPACEHPRFSHCH